MAVETASGGMISGDAARSRRYRARRKASGEGPPMTRAEQAALSKAWASRAPRDGQGRFAPSRPLDEAGEKARQDRIARDRALRFQQQDRRTRVGRRARAIERQLRDMLKRLGKSISIDVDLTIGQIASVAVRAEILRAEQSRGAIIPADKLTACANVIARGLSRIGLRPDMLDETGDRPSPGSSIANQRWGTSTKDRSPDGRARTAE
jgi:hypothetical protein